MAETELAHRGELVGGADARAATIKRCILCVDDGGAADDD